MLLHCRYNNSGMNPRVLTVLRLRDGSRTIAAVENRSSQTWIEVAPCHLNNDGRPGASDRRQDSFVARLQGNLDPAIYYQGRQLTVIGTLENRQAPANNVYAYDYPVVNVKAYHLWSPLSEHRGAHAAYSSWPSFYAPLIFPAILISSIGWRDRRPGH